MSAIISLDLSTSVSGRTWNLYAVDFETPDGTFSTYLYALSDEHAQLMLEDLKETAILRGQVVGTS